MKKELTRLLECSNEHVAVDLAGQVRHPRWSLLVTSGHFWSLLVTPRVLQRARCRRPRGAGENPPLLTGHVYTLRERETTRTSFYGSSCANNGKDALNTPDYKIEYQGPPVPITARVLSTPQTRII
eukprot:2215590-Pyramimonas_sp.AAC.1